MISKKIGTSSVGAVALAMTVIPAGADWEKLPPLPEPNGGFACGVDHGGIVLVGGTNWANGEKRWLRTVSRFHTETMRWEKTEEKLPQPLAYGVCGSIVPEKEGGSWTTLLILGGSDGNAPRRSFVTMSSLETATHPAPDLPKEVVLSAGGIIGDQFIVVGGTDDAANLDGLTNKTFAFDLNEETSIALADFPGKPFGIAASAVAGGELFVFGGANWNNADGTVANTAESYALSPAKNQWRKLKPYPLAARGHTAVALDAHRLYIAGGYGGEEDTFLSAAFIYDIRSDSYKQARPLPYAATVGLVLKGGFVYCLGGEDQMKSRTDAFWRVRVEDL